jgi:hypothetical protein
MDGRDALHHRGHRQPHHRAGAGTIDETFIGRDSGGRTGTISFTERYVLDPSGRLVINAKVIGGTGDFQRGAGIVNFTGTEVGAVTGNGTYVGRWKAR